MPKVHTIKSARKDYPAEGIKKGDTYFKWSIKTGPATGIIYRSKTYPKPSDLTGSPFQKSLLEIQEHISNLEASGYETAEDLSSELDGILGGIDSLRDETQTSLENMPESLQEGGVGQMLQERIDGLDSWISDLQEVDFIFDYDEEEPKQKEGEEEEAFNIRHADWENSKQEAESDFIDQAISDIQSMEVSI